MTPTLVKIGSPFLPNFLPHHLAYKMQQWKTPFKASLFYATDTSDPPSVNDLPSNLDGHLD
jgi:hypothetical protein